MMGLEIQRGLGLTREQALADAAAKGLWVTVQENVPTVSEGAHWHTWDTHLYLIEGEFVDMDPQDPTVAMQAGDYCVVPARTVHAGHATKKSVFVIGISQELLADVVIQHDPADL